MGSRLAWWLTLDGDEYCRELYERHYSGRNYKDGRKPKLFCGPGFKIVLRTWEADAVWVWKVFDDASGNRGVCCGLFRNESIWRSSDLIRQADQIADARWPNMRHYTYVDAKKIKSSNAGYCYQMAGWTRCGETKGGLIVMERLPLVAVSVPLPSICVGQGF